MNYLADIRRSLTNIKEATEEVGKTFDKFMNTKIFNKFVFMDPYYSRGDYIEREQRPCKRCKDRADFDDDTFHTTLECPVIGYDRVMKLKSGAIHGCIALRDRENRKLMYYNVKRVCMRI